VPAGDPEVYQQQAANAAKLEVLPHRYNPEETESPLMKMARIALEYAGPKAMGLGIDPVPMATPAAMVVTRATLPKLAARWTAMKEAAARARDYRAAEYGEFIDPRESAVTDVLNFFSAKNPKLVDRIKSLKLRFDPDDNTYGAVSNDGTKLQLNVPALSKDAANTAETIGHELYHAFVSRKPGSADRFYVYPSETNSGLASYIRNLLYKYQPEEIAANKAGRSARKTWERFQSLLKQEQGLE
jgi:hypothetical protein